MPLQTKKFFTSSSNRGLECNGVYGYTNLKDLTADLSFCVTIKVTADEYAAMNESINIAGCINGANYFSLTKRPAAGWLPGLTFSYCNSALTETQSIKHGFYNSVINDIIDGQVHKLVCVINSNAKLFTFYLDGVAVNDGQPAFKSFDTTPTAFTATNNFRIGTTPAFSIAGGHIISNIKLFNTPIDQPRSSGITYTLGDYQNDIPVTDRSELLIDLNNKLTGTTWVDESSNGHNMTLEGSYNIVAI